MDTKLQSGLGTVVENQPEVCDEFQEEVNTHKDRFGTKYDPREENFARLAAYHPSFVQLEKCCSEIMEEAAALLQNAEYQDARVTQLLWKCQENQKLTYPPAKKIGLIGDSGVGAFDAHLLH